MRGPRHLPRAGSCPGDVPALLTRVRVRVRVPVPGSGGPPPCRPVPFRVPAGL
ncbi:hypothetical protein TPA0909_06010 [Streptomyces albus]|nr:hypothetical protein TPA0909_06010 [Streptomyces albus]